MSDQSGDTWLARCFNEGADARLRGERLEANPYGNDSDWYRAWKKGWQDVDRYWGFEATRPVRKLPKGA